VSETRPPKKIRPIKAKPGTLVRCDEGTVPLTERYIAALRELLAAEAEMMTAAQPKHAEHWARGVAEIGDLSGCGSLAVFFGDDDEETVRMFHGAKEQWAVYVVEDGVPQ
jgi:predicted component of type VI protein secretion system